MAQFTTELSTILRTTADNLISTGVSEDDVDISTIKGIRNTAKAAFFTKDHTIDGDYREEIMAIDELFRDFFCTILPLHYFSDEIGAETVVLFKQYLMGTIYENSPFINTVLQNLDRNALRSYRVSKNDNVTAKSDYNESDETTARTLVTDHTGTKTVEGTDSYDESGTNSNTASDRTTGTVENNTGETGGERDTFNETHTGSDFGTVTKSGTDRDVLTGSTTKSGSTSDHGSKSSLETRNLHNKQKGSYIDTSNDTSSESSNSSAKYNGSNVFSDTPQGSISNLRSPDVDLTGKGISAIHDSSFNYMTNATLADNTQVNGGSTSSTGTSTKTHNGNNFDNTNEGTVSVSDTTNNTGTSSENGSENKTNTKTINITDTTNMTHTDSHTGYNDKDFGKEVNSTEETDTTVAHTGSASDTKSHEGENSSTETLALNDNTEDNGSRNSTSKGASNEVSNGNAEDYEYSIEFLLQAEPIISKLWKIFDPCFFQIIGVFN